MHACRKDTNNEILPLTPCYISDKFSLLFTNAGSWNNYKSLRNISTLIDSYIRELLFPIKYWYYRESSTKDRYSKVLSALSEEVTKQKLEEIFGYEVDIKYDHLINLRRKPVKPIKKRQSIKLQIGVENRAVKQNDKFADFKLVRKLIRKAD